MSKSKWLVISVAAALSAGGFFILKSQAAEGAPPKRLWRGQLLERAREKLGLTDDQVAQIKTELYSPIRRTSLFAYGSS